MGQTKDQAIRDIVKGAGFVYSGLVLEMAIAFLAQVLAARYLSVSDFGGVTAGVALLNIGAIVSSVGFGNGLARYFPRHDAATKSELARAGFLITFPVSVVIGGLVTLNAEFLAADVFGDPTVTPSILIFGATIPFAATLRVVIGGIQGQKNARYRVYVENLVRPVVRFSLVIVAVVYGLGQAGFAGSYALPYALGSVLAVVLLARTLPELTETWKVDWGLTWSVLRYSAPFILSSTAGFIYRSADIFLLLYFLDSEAVGIYGVAYAAAKLMLMFSTAFNFMSMPVASELESGGGIAAAVDVQRPVLRWIAAASIPVFVPLVLFSSEFISIVYASRYADGAVALSVLVAGFAVHNVLSTQSNLLKALGRSKLIAANSAVSAVVNVVLNILLIPQWGIEGAAVATVISYLLYDALFTLELWYDTGEVILGWDLAEPVALALPLLAAVWYVKPIVPPSLVVIVGMTAVFSLTFFVTLLVVTGIGPEEEMVILSIQERLGIENQYLNTLLERLS